MPTPISRAAIVGTGRIGSTYDDEVTDKHEPSFYRGELRHNGLYTALPVNHAGAYRTTPGFALIAAANRSDEKLRAFGERWGVKALYTDFRRMLRDERPDVVSVCTQSDQKAAVTIAAAEAGVKAIVVEKAMATSLAEADAMLAACARHGVLLAVNHPNRFSLANRKVKALIESGAIGQPGTVAGYSVSGMLHGGSHTFDLLRYLAGDVVEIWARVPDYAPEKDLPATASLWFANGMAGFVDHVHQIPPGFEVRGTAGYLTTSTSVGDGWLYRALPFHPTGTRTYPNRLSIEPIEAEPSSLSPTQRLLAELHQTLSEGAPYVSTGHDGAAALELGIACYASHLAGGPIKLPLADRTLRIPNR
ncbi:MAG: Gfo/Idh/MocA family protein [Candidatus Dormibacteraceae bacterium]